MRSSVLLTVLQAAACIAGAANHKVYHRQGHSPARQHLGPLQNRDVDSSETIAAYSNGEDITPPESTSALPQVIPSGAVSGHLPLVTASTNNASESSYLATLTAVVNFKPMIPVVTKVVDVGTAQILPSPISKPDTTGTVQTSLNKTGHNTEIPILTKAIATPTTTVSTTEVIPPKLRLPKMNLISPDIFAIPVATGAPSTVFKRRTDHPVPRLGITGSGPFQTNKFYAAAFLGSQTSPIYMMPYAVSWARGGGSSKSWGMCISHVDANQRVYGPVEYNRAVQYYANPVGIQSVCLSASELGSSTALTTDGQTQFAVRVSLRARAGATPMVQFPMVIGSAFVTAVYNGAHPIVGSGVFFKTVTKVVKAPKTGVVKYKLYLEDGKVWIVYARHVKGNPLDLQVTNNGVAQAKSAFYGTIQVAKDPGGFEASYDKAAGAYATDIALSGSTQGGMKGQYSFKFAKAGLTNTAVAMFALNHHVATFDYATKQGLTSLRMQTPTKGAAALVLSDTWTMVEFSLPISISFWPWSPTTGMRTIRSTQVRAAIRAVAVSEISQDVDAQTNQPSMYFAGKALAKFASVCFTTNRLLGDQALAQTCLVKLKASMARFTQNRQQFPLVYESAWRGLVSSASYTTGNSGEDFGNTYYNDHHFHYGYHVFAAAVIGYLDPSWIAANKDWVNALVRDYANPNSKDGYFPVSRMFDWYHGHSWAHGLFDTLDGKDQESSSEDTMSIYAVKMWGMVIGDSNMVARANMQLAVMSHSLGDYYLYRSGNKVQPSNFIGNKAAGILFENKVDHTTYFGRNIEYIQGIHMLPLLPHTPMCRSPAFVWEEWQTFFNNGRINNIPGGWKGIIMGNYGTILPKEAYQFFSQANFDASWLDGGASRTWYMAYTAAMANL